MVGYLAGPVGDAVAEIRAAHHLDAVRAQAAWVCAPFGQAHVDDAATSLRGARALRVAAERGELAALAFTSQEANATRMPGWVRVVRLGPIPGWPAPEAYQNRFVKWAVPFLLPNVTASLYADGDLQIVGDGAWLRALFALIEARELVVTEHTRSGWTDELAAIMEDSRYLARDRLEAQRVAYEAEGLPALGPVYQNNCIGRRHGSRLDSLSAIVLEQLRVYSHRDQLALPYAVWKTGLTPFACRAGRLLLTPFYRRGFSRATCGLVDPTALGLYLRLRWSGEILSGSRFAPRAERILLRLRRASRRRGSAP